MAHGHDDTSVTIIVTLADGSDQCHTARFARGTCFLHAPPRRRSASTAPASRHLRHFALLTLTLRLLTLEATEITAVPPLKTILTFESLRDKLPYLLDSTAEISGPGSSREDR